MDLTVDLGIPGQLDHPTAVRAVQKLIDVAGENGVAAGIITAELATIDHWVSRGMRFVSYATEEIHLQRAAAEAVDRLRAIRRRRAGDESQPEQARLGQAGE
jgi:2-keto-3-deoxy-L-rhamnonate aldolase RhmA